MPTLGNHLDFAKLEARNVAVHNLTTPPSSPVAGQMYFDTTPGDLTLYWYDGSSWIPAKDIGGGGAPTGAAGGDLSGTYPNPTIGTGKVTSTHIADGTITDTDVATANKDGTTLVPSLRTLSLGGATSAMPGNARLDSIATSNAPVSALNLNTQRIAFLGTPVSDTDAATKAYVDGVAQGLDAKQSVKAATTVNVANMAAAAPLVVDGVTLLTNDRVLVKDQTTAGENGVYLVSTAGSGSNGIWQRASDMNAWAEVPSAFVFVEQGTTQADSGWVTTADVGGTLGTTAMPWVQFSGAGQITSGAGLTKTGNTLDVGAGSGITVNADTVQVANDGITNAMLADGAVSLAGNDVTGTLPLTKGGTGGATAGAARTSLGAAGVYMTPSPATTGTTHTITQATHGLTAGQGLIVGVCLTGTGQVEIPDIVIAANGDVTITWGASTTQFTRRVTIVG